MCRRRSFADKMQPTSEGHNLVRSALSYNHVIKQRSPYVLLPFDSVDGLLRLL